MTIMKSDYKNDKFRGAVKAKSVTTVLLSAVMLTAVISYMMYDPESPLAFSSSSPTHTSKAVALTGDIDHEGKTRMYEICECENQRYALEDLHKAFSAHTIEWNIMGRDEPWWSVLTNPSYKGLQDLPEADKDTFFESGKHHVKRVLYDLETTFPGFELKRGSSVLDFGCGVGRLAFAFAELEEVDHVACVDQSIYHLNVVDKEYKRLNKEDWASVETTVSSPNLLAALQGRQFDLVHSVIVLQHMLPQLQQAYLEQFCDALLPGGHAWLQIPTQTPDPANCDIELSIQRGGMQMHYTKTECFGSIFQRRGCRVDVKDLGTAFIGAEGSTDHMGVALLVTKSG